ncbi:hypothetical protein ACLOJK_034987 [Asimina triloba]
MGLGLLDRGGSLSTNGDEHRRGAAGVVMGSGIAGRRTVRWVSTHLDLLLEDDGSGERGVGVMGCRRPCWLASEKKALLIVAAANWIWAVDLVRWLADGGAAARRRDADGWRACRRWTEEIADQAVMGSAAMVVRTKMGKMGFNLFSMCALMLEEDGGIGFSVLSSTFWVAWIGLPDFQLELAAGSHGCRPW